MLEELINVTNERYKDQGLALVQKIPTPITPIDMDKEKGHITLAYFEKKSTVDYIGVVQGIPVCFDAKECHEDTFALANVHDHQVDFMRRFEKQEGIAFLLINFTARDVYYYMRLRELEVFLERAEKGGRKSFRLDELDSRFMIKDLQQTYIPYLELIKKDLEERED